MPHQCVRCGKFYVDTATTILKGCSCGGRLFFFIKKEKLQEIRNREPLQNLTQNDKLQIEKDVRDIIGMDEEQDEPVILDLESIRITKPGQYELDLVSLMNRNPLVIKVSEGKYMIDLIRTFESLRDKD